MGRHPQVILILLTALSSFTKTNLLNTTETLTILTSADCHKLQNEVIPKHYEINLTLLTNFETTGTFSGLVKIIVRPTLNTQKEIKFHAKGLTLEPLGVKLYNSTDSTRNNLITSYEVNPNVEMVICKIKPLIANHDYILEIPYVGIFSQDLFGFYRTSYINEDGNLEWIATTQFSPVHARKAFPCFDEPNLKATFDVHITHPNDYHALSNTEVISIKKVNKTSLQTSFGRTPVMSTYILAFLISKFASISVNVNGLSNAIWARKNIIEKGTLALNLAPKVLKAMENLTEIPFSESGLTKLHNAAIPEFAAGGMENWGLIANRETLLLWDLNESTSREIQVVAHLLGHELAHQWFGNLVTMDWWSSTWLKEGFATFFEYRAVELIEKSWEQDKRFVVEQHQNILISDALISSQPLTSEAFTPSEISSKFGGITYVKGGSIIRMLEHMLGSHNFFKGVKVYLHQNLFGNAKPEHLWSAMSLFANNTSSPGLPTDLAVIMTLWTEQAGFPVVTVSASRKDVVFTQKRFLFEPEETSNQAWYIPISYTTSSTKNFTNTAPKLWMCPHENAVLNNVLQDQNSWIIVNIQETTYYRVNYDNRLWDALQNALRENNFDGIDVINRAQIVDDAMNLARAGIITYTRALNILLYLEKEINYFPWFAAFNAFSYLRRRIDSTTELAQLLNNHISGLMQQLYEDVSFEDVPLNQVEINKKVLTLTWVCDLGDSECLHKAKNLFRMFVEDQIMIEPDLRGVVYCTALRNSYGNENWNFLWRRLSDPTIFLETTTLITALGCTKNEELLSWYLQQTIDPTSPIKKQHAQSVFMAVIYGNPEGVTAGLEFIKNNFTSISENYRGWNVMSSMITGLADRLTTEEQIHVFAEFIEQNSEQLGVMASVAQAALESSRKNLEWVRTHSEELLRYLKELQI